MYIALQSFTVTVHKYHLYNIDDVYVHVQECVMSCAKEHTHTRKQTGRQTNYPR